VVALVDTQEWAESAVTLEWVAESVVQLESAVVLEDTQEWVESVDILQLVEALVVTQVQVECTLELA
jgi:hypothetical protein